MATDPPAPEPQPVKAAESVTPTTPEPQSTAPAAGGTEEHGKKLAAGAREWHRRNEQLYKSLTTDVERWVKSILESKVPIVALKSRRKDEESFCKKIAAKVADKEEPYKSYQDCEDICGCRVICLTKQQILDVRDLMKGAGFEILESSWRVPQKTTFGYTSYHMVLRVGPPRTDWAEYKDYVGLKFELQIRTGFQEAWAELDHKINYEEVLKVAPEDKRAIERIAALVELADKEWAELYDKYLKAKT